MSSLRQHGPPLGGVRLWISCSRRRKINSEFGDVDNSFRISGQRGNVSAVLRQSDCGRWSKRLPSVHPTNSQPLTAVCQLCSVSIPPARLCVRQTVCLSLGDGVNDTWLAKKLNFVAAVNELQQQEGHALSPTNDTDPFIQFCFIWLHSSMHSRVSLKLKWIHYNMHRVCNRPTDRSSKSSRWLAINSWPVGW